MTLDAATQQFLSRLAESNAPPLHRQTPQQARARGPILRQLIGEGPAMARVENVALPVEGGEIALRVQCPTTEPRGVLVYYHGGGWVIGDIEEFDTLGRQLATSTGCAVVLVNYRLAPEYPFPTPVEDAWQALRWVDAQMEALVGRRVPLIVAGDSAGANLATVVARRARDRAGPEIALQVMVYPVTDADPARESYHAPENQLLLNQNTMKWFWGHYAPDAESRQHPDASPLLASSLAGMPPALVITAEFDPLRDEGEAYAARMVSEGVPVVFRRYPAQMHGFFQMANILPASARAVAEIAQHVALTLDAVEAV